MFTTDAFFRPPRPSTHGLRSAPGRTWACAGRARSVDRANLFEPLEARQLLAAVTWDGGGDGLSWHDHRNWSADVLPAANDDVSIGAEWSKVRISADAGQVRVRSLHSAAAIESPDGWLHAATTIDVLAGASLGKASAWSADQRIDLGGVIGDRLLISGLLNAPAVRVDSGAGGYTLIDGRIAADSATGRGGSIVVLGQRVALVGATLTANGRDGGGTIEVGGSRFGRGPLPNSQYLYVDGDSVMRADATMRGDGGQVIAYASEFTAFQGTAGARGGSLNGNGGFIETSGGVSFEVLPAAIDAAAPKGAGGLWVLDPTDVGISAVANSGVTFNTGTGAFAFVGTPASAVLGVTNLIAALNAGVSTVIYTRNPGAVGAGNITVATPINVNLAAGSATLTLRAANNVVISQSVSNSGAGTLNVVLQANNGTGPLGNEPNDDPNTAAGDVQVNAQFSLPNNGTFTASGVNLTTNGSGNIIAAGGITANMTGDVSLANSLIQSVSGAIALNSGTDGTGNISASAAISLNAANMTLRAGDGSGGTNTATFSTTNMTFRSGVGGATSPGSLTLRQDAAVTDAQIPTAGQFGAALTGMNYSIRSDASAVQLVAPAKLTGTNLTLNSSVAGNFLGGTYSLASLSVISPVTLSSATTITTTGGMFFGGTINGAQTLTLNSSGSVELLSAVGGATALTSFTSDAGGSISVVSITTTGAITLNDPTVTLNGVYTTGNANFTSNTNNPQLTLLAGNVTVSAGAGQIRFNSEIQSSGAARSLSLTGSLVIFGNSVGGQNGAPESQRLLSLNVTGTLSIGNLGPADDRAIRTTGNAAAMVFNSQVNLNDDITFDTGPANTSAAITFNNLVTNGAADGTLRDLTVLSQGTTTFSTTIGLGTFGSIGAFITDSGGSTFLGGSVNSTGGMTLADNVTLAAITLTSNGNAITLGNTTLTGSPSLVSGGGARTFSGTLNGAHPLTLTGAGLLSFNGTVGGVTPLTSLTASLGGPTITFNTSVITVNGPITFNVPVTQQAVATTIAATGNVLFNQPINAAVAGIGTLLVNSPGTTQFSGIGGATRLASVTTDAAGTTVIVTGVNIVNNGTFNDNVKVGSLNFSSTSGSFTFNGTLSTDADGPESVTLNAASTIALNGGVTIGAFLALNSLSATATTIFLGGNINLLNDLSINGATVLAGNVAIDVGGSVAFGSTVNSDSPGSRSLSVTAHQLLATSTTFGGANRLSSFSLNSINTSFVGSVSTQNSIALTSPDITLDGVSYSSLAGTIVFNGPVVLRANATIAGSTVDFQGTLNSDPGQVAGRSLVVNGGVGGTFLRGALGGGIRPLGSLTVNGPTQLSTTVLTTSTAGGAPGVQTYNGTVRLDVAGTFVFDGGQVTLGPVTHSLAPPAAPSLLVLTPVSLNGNLGSALSPLREITFGGIVTVNAATQTFTAPGVGGTGDQLFGSQNLLNAPLTVNIAGAGTGTFASLEGPSSFTLNGNATFADNFGFFTPLSTITLNGVVNLNAPLIRSTGAQSYTGAVTLTRTTGVIFTTTAGGDIAFGSSVNPGVGGSAMTLNSAGTVTFAGPVGNTLAMNSMFSNAGGSISFASTVTTTGQQIYNDAAIAIAEPMTTTNNQMVFAGAVTLNNGPTADLTISTGTGNVTFQGMVNGARRFVVNSAGSTTFQAAVGSTTRPIIFVTDSAGTSSFRDLRVTGALFIGDPTTLNGVVDAQTSTFNVGTATLAGPTTLIHGGPTPTGLSGEINGAFPLTITSTPGLTLPNLGPATPLASLTVNGSGTTTLAGTVNTTGDIAFSNLAALSGNPVLTTSTGNITFNANVFGGGNLSLSSPGAVSFAGQLGVGTPITGLTSDGGPTGSFSAQSINSSGALNILDPTVTLSGAVTSNSGGPGANITLNSPGGGLTLLSANITFQAGAGNVRFNGDARSAGGVNRSLTVNSTSSVVFAGNVGGALGAPDDQRFATISATSPTVTFGDAGPSDERAVRTNFNGFNPIQLGSQVRLADHITLDTGAANTSVSQTFFSAIDQAAAGAPFRNLTINSSGAITITGLIGANVTTGPIGAFTSDAPGTLTLNAAIITIGAQSYLDSLVTFPGSAATFTTQDAPFTLGPATVLRGQATITTGTGNITINGTVNGNNNLTLNSAGTVLITGAVGGTTRLGGFTSDAAGSAILGSINANSITLNDAAITLNGVYGSPTLVTPFLAAGAVTLGGPTSVNSSSGPGIQFSSTIDGPHPLTISAGFGPITLQGAVGSVTRVGDVLLSSTSGGPSAVSTVAISAASITRTGSGASTFGVLDTNAPAGISLTGGNTNLQSVTTTNGGPLVINSDLVVIFASGATVALDGPLTQQGLGFLHLPGVALTTTNDAVSFASEVRITSGSTTISAGSANIALGSTLNGPGAIVLNSTGAVTIAGSSGNLSPLSGFTSNAGGTLSLRDLRSGANVNISDTQTTLNGTYNLTGGTANFNVSGNVILAGNTLIQANGGRLTVGSGSINADAAANNRTLDIRTSGETQLPAVGNTAALASLITDSPGTLITGSITVINSLTLGEFNPAINGNLAVTSGNLTISSAPTFSANTILSASTVILGGALAGANNLTFRAADVILNGNLTGTGALRLEPLAATQGITFGGPGGTPAVDLSSSTLSRIQPGFSAVTFGRNDGSGVFTFSAPLTLVNPTTFLAPQPGGQFIVNASITATGNGSITFTGSGSTILLGANITTAGQPILFDDAIEVVAPNILIDSTANNTVPNGAPITFEREVRELTGLPQTFTVRASTAGTTGNINIKHSFGTSLARFGTLTFITSPTADTVFTFIDGPRNLASANLVINSRIKMNGEYLFLADTVTINGPIDNGGVLTVAAPVATFNGPIGATTPLGAFTGVGTHRFNIGIVLATGPVSIGPALLGADTTVGSLTSTVGLGDITGNGRTLTVNAPGNISLTSAADLATLVTAGGGGTFIFGNIFTTGNQTYNNAVTIGATPVELRSTAGTITFIAGFNAGANNLTLTAPQIDILGPSTGTGLLVIQPFDKNQNISVVGPEGTEPLDISQTDLNNLSGFDEVTIGRLDGDGSLDAGVPVFGTDTTLAMAGPAGRITATAPRGTGNSTIQIRGSGSTTSILQSITTSGGAIRIFDAVKLLGPNVRIDTTNNGTAPGGAVLLDRVVNSATGQTNDLRIDSGAGAVTLNGSIGTAPQGQLGELIINGTGPANLNAPQITTTGPQTYTNPVTLGAGVTITNQNAPVTFGSSINGANNLTIAPGTGQTTFNGAIGNSANPTNLTINAGNTRTFNGAVAVRTLTVFGGIVEFNDASTAEAGVFISGQLRGSGVVTFSGPLTWTGGSMTGAGRTVIGPDGALVLTGNTKTLGRTIENRGVAFWTDGQINLANGAIENNVGATFYAQSDDPLVGGAGVNSLRNLGYFERSGSTTPLQLTNITLENTGTIAVVDGTVSLTPAGGTFTNAGTISLPVGRVFNVVGDFVNGGTGNLRIEFAALAPGQSGLVTVSGNAQLGGRLTAVQTAPITAVPGNRVDLVQAASVTGQFATVDVPLTGVERRKLAATYLPDRAQLLFTFSSDFNLDGELNQEDLGGFITAFLLEPSEISADFNLDGVVDQEDLIGFITDYFLDA